MVSFGYVEFVVLILSSFLILKFFNRNNNDNSGEGNRASLPGHVSSLSTPFGDVSIRVLGQPGGTLPVICLPGMNPKLTDEWVYVADVLARNGCHVVIINFHSNPKSTPSLLYGGVSDEDVQQIIEVAMGYLGVKQTFLFGKSWGGSQAINFAVKNPKAVLKLGLIAPASSDSTLIEKLQSNSIKVFLAWALDDTALWFYNTKHWQTVMGDQLTFASVEKGGHRILPEYAEKLLAFIKN
jgi:pimeloyl-ACP methyl ester carboxylesterase